MTPLIRRRPARRRARARATSTSRTTRPTGPRSPTRTAWSAWPSPARSSWAARDRLRLHRQRRHGGRRARRQGRATALHLLPGQHGEGQGEGLPRARRPGLPARRQLRPGQPGLPRAVDATGMQFANITLRPFYAEGAKTMAFEVVEQLGWNAPDHFVIPAAGGTLSSRVHKGLNELEKVGLAQTARPTTNIAQASGCSPIATAITRERRRDRPPDARDRRPLAGDRRPRRRRPGRRRGAQPRRLRRRCPTTRRSSPRWTCSAPPRGSSPSRPAARRSPRR